MGATQLGLAALSALAQGWPSIAIDIKDCFSIPLHPQGAQRFAFTLPTLNPSFPEDMSGLSYPRVWQIAL